MSDPTPVPEVPKSIADLLSASIAAHEAEGSPADKIECPPPKAKKAKAEVETYVINVPALVMMPEKRVLLPTFMKHVYLSMPKHQVLCQKCGDAIVANEMATTKQIADGSESWRHMKCMGTQIIG